MEKGSRTEISVMRLPPPTASTSASSPAGHGGLTTSSTQATPVKKGKCFRCGHYGHWAAHCPQNPIGYSQPNPSRVSATAAAVRFPEIMCRCGAGICKPLVSRSPNSFGNVYYRCPAESWKRCNFYMWHEKLGSRSIQRYDHPICRCGAGVCILVWEGGRQCFKCRVPKGHGACSFRQWLDMPISTTNSVQMVNDQFKVRQPLGKQVDHPLVMEDDCGGKRLKITELDEGSSVTDCAQLSSNSEVSLACPDTKEGSVMSPMELQDLPPDILREIMECEYPLLDNDNSGCKQLKITEIEGSQEIISTELSSPQSTISLEFSNGNEISTLNAADFDPFDTDEDFMNEVIAFESSLVNVDEPWEVLYGSQEKVNEAAPPKYQDVHHRQSNFCKRMLSAATGLPEANCICLMLGAQYLGWLSRLAFGSPRGLVLPLPKPLFCCIFPNFDPIFIRRGLGQNGDKNQIVSTVGKSFALSQVTAPQESLVVDVPDITLKEPPALRSPPYVAEANNVMDAAIMEAFGQAAMLIQSKLFTRLESMDPSSHESMVKEANTVFESLDRLKVDYRQFYHRVKDFIGAASSLNQIKLSIHNGVLYQDYLDRCNQEKLRLEQLSAEHDSVMTSLMRSQERLQSLQNEAEEARNRLLQIEQKISACNMEAKNLKIHLTELSEQMNECEDSLLCASLEAEAAQKLSLQREAELNAAQNVFEEAKIQLRDSAG